jgi:peptidoglycan hydrolase-like protein with peptidoglycan-binding domain
MRRRLALALPLLLASAALAAPAGASTAEVAALQVALHVRGLYAGPIDGVAGPATKRAVRVFQRRARLTVDGVAGPLTRRALGRLGRPLLGKRIMRRDKRGWDVAQLQFELAWHGFPSGPFDGIFGPRVERALRRYQEWAGLEPDGLAGPATLGALTAPPPRPTLPLAWPLQAPLTSPFGPRGDGFHPGIDLAAPTGTPVYAARSGEVVWAGPFDGYGYLVTIAHGEGERSMYAHLSRIDVSVGVRVGQGVRVGAVGATGEATGPHLHFEVRVRGASVDPLLALPGL